MATKRSQDGRSPSLRERVASAAHMASPASEQGAKVTNGGLSAKFAHFSNRVAIIAGNYKTFLVMLTIVLAWAITGPIFKFSTTWQLIINTGTTIVTFLMVFLIQNTQNRDSLALHLKLDEIIRAIDKADNRLIEAEDETDEQLAELKEKYQQLLQDDDQGEAQRSQPADAPARR